MTTVDSRLDTVERAVTTPEELQPYAELGLRPDEYDRIREILGRRPTQAELAMYSIMWSEHCSYKSSKVHLRQFGEKNPPSDRLLAGMGENAGVIRVSDDLAVTFKIESHNHPSFVEPYQGAATGVGGIVRDILAMGARPVAVMDSLRFGAAAHEDTARVLPGVVGGIGGYGNCLGLPNIGGEVLFDPCYQGNPLVNALCLGVLPVTGLQQKAAAGPGNVVVLIGAKTGRDGIGGVSVLASATFDDESGARRPSVQVGDPFTEKLLIEACLELYHAGLVVGIQDLGGAGLTCALSETAAAAGTGMSVQLDAVPLREPSMEPHEVLASESQERMLLIVAPQHVDAVLGTCDKWGVLATPIGEVTPRISETEPGRLIVSWRGTSIVDVPPGSLADDGPVYARPMREPADLILLQADRAETLPRPRGGDALRETLLRLLASPNLCDKSWITEQYDRYVLGNTVLAQPENAGVIRVDEQTQLGVAISVDGNGRFTRLDPYAGTRLALAEAYRNVSATGATPVAVTNCLNFGSPEDPTVMWQFAEAVRGLADGCAELGIPVTGGNVSFYNQTGAAPIHPTPVVGVLGILPDVRHRMPMGFAADGEVILLLGDTRSELSGSEWAWVTHGHLGGMPPRVDLVRERALGRVLVDAANVGHISSAHDLSEGGLAIALAESCLRRGLGAQIALPDGADAFPYLFSESTGRALVTVPRGHEKAFAGLCTEHGVPWTPLGVVDAKGFALDIRDQFHVPLTELRQAHAGTLPGLFAPEPVVTVTPPERQAGFGTFSGSVAVDVPAGVVPQVETTPDFSPLAGGPLPDAGFAPTEVGSPIEWGLREPEPADTVEPGDLIVIEDVTVAPAEAAPPRPTTVHRVDETIRRAVFVDPDAAGSVAADSSFGPEAGAVKAPEVADAEAAHGAEPVGSGAAEVAEPEATRVDVDALESAERPEPEAAAGSESADLAAEPGAAEHEAAEPVATAGPEPEAVEPESAEPESAEPVADGGPASVDPAGEAEAGDRTPPEPATAEAPDAPAPEADVVEEPSAKPTRPARTKRSRKTS